MLFLVCVVFKRDVVIIVNTKNCVCEQLSPETGDPIPLAEPLSTLTKLVITERWAYRGLRSTTQPGTREAEYEVLS